MFEALRPRCVLCLAAGEDAPLELAAVWTGQGGEVDEGLLLCPRGVCQREYPIVDGMPILVGPLRAWVRDHAHILLRRRDLHGELNALLGECLGAGDGWEYARSLESGYVSDHWDGGGTAVAALEAGLALFEGSRSGPWIDLGCGPGATTAAISRSVGGFVLGVDLNPGLLRYAREARNLGRIRYERRREGLIYDRRDLPAPGIDGERVDFWVADACALPFGPTFAGAASIHVLDSVEAPLAHLREIQRVLHPGAQAVISTTFDWSAAATPVEQWLSGHGGRGVTRGDGPSTLRPLLSHLGLEPTAERDDLPWVLRTSARTETRSRAFVVAAERQACALPF